MLSHILEVDPDGWDPEISYLFDSYHRVINLVIGLFSFFLILIILWTLLFIAVKPFTIINCGRCCTKSLFPISYLVVYYASEANNLIFFVLVFFFQSLRVNIIDGDFICFEYRFLKIFLLNSIRRPTLYIWIFIICEHMRHLFQKANGWLACEF